MAITDTIPTHRIKGMAQPFNAKMFSGMVFAVPALSFIFMFMIMNKSQLTQKKRGVPHTNMSKPAYLTTWTLSLMMMSYAIYRVHNAKLTTNHMPLIYYGIQLFLIHLWPVLHFALNNHVASFINSALLVVVNHLNVVEVAKYERMSAMLLAAPSIWMTYLASVNYSVVCDENPKLLKKHK